uniref:Uncharacterized protein n=1 Tax=Physcomitrium patens TaxID=3218 RepID=A0A7I4BQL0_PHYPA
MIEEAEAVAHPTGVVFSKCCVEAAYTSKATWPCHVPLSANDRPTSWSSNAVFLDSSSVIVGASAKSWEVSDGLLISSSIPGVVRRDCKSVLLSESKLFNSAFYIYVEINVDFFRVMRVTVLFGRWMNWDVELARWAMDCKPEGQEGLRSVELAEARSWLNCIQALETIGHLKRACLRDLITVSLQSWQELSRLTFCFQSPIDKPPAHMSQCIAEIFFGSHGCKSLD